MGARIAVFSVLLAIVGTASAFSGTAQAASNRSVDCLARALYFEARGEGVEGMAAVAAVVLNRVEHGEFPDAVCAVVEQGGETPPCQFSYWCDGLSDRPNDEELWELSRRVARRALAGELDSPVADALFFHSAAAGSPFRQREYVATVGGHRFYR